jgi:hypothetical protein
MLTGVGTGLESAYPLILLLFRLMYYWVKSNLSPVLDKMVSPDTR